MDKLILVSIVYRGRRFVRGFMGTINGRNAQVNEEEFNRFLDECGVINGTTYTIDG